MKSLDKNNAKKRLNRLRPIVNISNGGQSPGRRPSDSHFVLPNLPKINSLIPDSSKHKSVNDLVITKAINETLNDFDNSEKCNDEESKEENCDLTFQRQQLWNNLRHRTELNVDTGGLRRLLTFVENPVSFLEKRKNESEKFPQLELSDEAKQTLIRLKTFYTPPTDNLMRSETHIFPRENALFLGSQARTLVGGTAIDCEIASTLRKRVYGSTIHSFSSEWRRNHFQFSDPRGPHSFGLTAHKDGARGLLLCVNAYFIKHLLYSPTVTIIDKYRSSFLQSTDAHRRECLVRAFTDLLWKVGGQRRACVSLPSENTYVEASQQYRPDGVTERLHLFTFYKWEELKSFLKRHFSYFESPHGYGCILFLYSIALSRRLDWLLEDFEFDESICLLGESEQLTQPCINLLLTGRASKHVHNGAVLDADNQPLYGIQDRADVGFLTWDKSNLDNPCADNHVGSMLKTPKIPIWLTLINNSFGLLFATNAELLTHWRSENTFTLIYYTALCSSRPCQLTINTRTGRAQSRYRPRLAAREEERKIPALEHCIRTKWFGALINWNGTIPFF